MDTDRLHPLSSYFPSVKRRYIKLLTGSKSFVRKLKVKLKNGRNHSYALKEGVLKNVLI
jgi:hypothetical protein